MVDSTDNDRPYLRRNSIVTVSSIAVDGLVRFEERNDGN